MRKPANRKVLGAVCVLALATELMGQKPPVSSPAIAFVHVSVVPMDTDHVMKEQTLVVQGDRIAMIGPTATTDIPPDALRIDASNQYLIPGLADMHVHLQRDRGPDTNRWMLALFLANGITTVRNMWGTPGHLRLRKNIESGLELGPTIFTTGPVIDGSPPMWKDSTVVESATAAREVVIQQKQDGYDFIKVYSRLTRTAYDAIVATAKAENIRVVGHTPIAVGLKGVLAAGQASIEHLDGYVNEIESADSPVYGKTDWYSQMIAYSFIDSAKLEASVIETREAGAWNCPTLVTMSKWVSPEDRAALLLRPEMKYVPPQVRQSWDDLYRIQLGGFSRLDFRKLRESDVARSRIVDALNKGGAHILAGTDTPNAFVLPGYSLHEELQKLVAAGLTPYQALGAATRDAAVFLDKLDEFGTIAVGKRADLVLLAGDPLTDISNVDKIVGIVVRGHWLPSAALQEMVAYSSQPASESAPTK